MRMIVNGVEWWRMFQTKIKGDSREWHGMMRNGGECQLVGKGEKLLQILGSGGEWWGICRVGEKGWGMVQKVRHGENSVEWWIMVRNIGE